MSNLTKNQMRELVKQRLFARPESAEKTAVAASVLMEIAACPNPQKIIDSFEEHLKLLPLSENEDMEHNIKVCCNIVHDLLDEFGFINGCLTKREAIKLAFELLAEDPQNPLPPPAPDTELAKIIETSNVIRIPLDEDVIIEVGDDSEWEELESMPDDDIPIEDVRIIEAGDSEWEKPESSMPDDGAPIGVVHNSIDLIDILYFFALFEEYFKEQCEHSDNQTNKIRYQKSQLPSDPLGLLAAQKLLPEFFPNIKISRDKLKSDYRFASNVVNKLDPKAGFYDRCLFIARYLM